MIINSFWHILSGFCHFPKFLIFTKCVFLSTISEAPFGRVNKGNQLSPKVVGSMHIIFRVLVSSSVAKGYIFVHENFCLYPLPWDSPVTWIVAAIGIDFCYYWVHRAAHGELGLGLVWEFAD